jgi:guanylate kinase
MFRPESLHEYAGAPRHAQFFVISSGMGVGKTFAIDVIQKIFTQHEGQPRNFSRSVTTRPQRENDLPDQYHYVSSEEFEELIRTDYFLEYSQHAGHYYGTPRNDGSALLEIEVNGFKQIVDSENDVEGIFILPPSVEEHWSRLSQRPSDDTPLPKRFQRLKRFYDYEIPMAYELPYTYVLNDSFASHEQALHRIMSGFEPDQTASREHMFSLIYEANYMLHAIAVAHGFPVID